MAKISKIVYGKRHDRGNPLEKNTGIFNTDVNREYSPTVL